VETYIKTFENYNNSVLDSTTNLIYSFITSLKKSYNWVYDYYEPENFSFMIKIQIDLKDMETNDIHPLNYNYIHSNEFNTKEELKEIIYLKKNSTFKILWGLDNIKLDGLHFDINIGTDVNYRLDSEDIASDEMIEEYKEFLDKQKEILDRVSKIKGDSITRKGYHFPNFWISYLYDFNLDKIKGSAYKKFNS